MAKKKKTPAKKKAPKKAASTKGKSGLQKDPPPKPKPEPKAVEPRKPGPAEVALLECVGKVQAAAAEARHPRVKQLLGNDGRKLAAHAKAVAAYGE